MHIHFICTGNTYRSRLAEAYLRSKNIKGVQVSSSGIKAHENRNGPITWYAARLARKHDLTNHVTHTWIQTTPQHIRDADMVIFMDQKHYTHAKTTFGNIGRYEIWNIPDLVDLGFVNEVPPIEEDVKRIKATEKTFEEIKKNVDQLVWRLTQNK